MFEIAPARRSQESQVLCQKYIGYVQTFSIFFHRFDFKTRTGYVKKHDVSITVLTNINWVKPAQTSNSIFSTSTLLMKGLQETTAEPAG